MTATSSSIYEETNEDEIACSGIFLQDSQLLKRPALYFDSKYEVHAS